MSANHPRRPDEPVPVPETKFGKPIEGDSLAEIELGNEGLIEFGELPPSQEASKVALAQLPDPPSGQSLTTWTEVIRRQRAAQEDAGSGPMSVDAPSDKDLLGRLSADSRARPAGKQPGDTSEILPSQLPVFGQAAADPAGESAIDLGKALAGRAAGGSEVRFDILYPPSDAGGAIPLPADAPRSDDSLPKGMAVPIPYGALDDADAIPFALAVGPGLSGLDLGADPGFAGDDGRSSILDVLLSESKLVEDPGPPSEAVRSRRPTMPTAGAGPDKLAIPTQPGIDFSDEPFDLSSDPDGSMGSDDSVDLLAEGAGPASLTDSGTLEISDQAIEQSQRRSEQQDSSAIDLDSQPSVAGSVFDVDVESAARKKSDAEIDLDLPPLEDGSGSHLHRADALEANREAIAAEFRARKQGKPVPPRPGGRDLVPVRAGSPGGRGKYLAFGGALGLLVGVGAMLAAAFAGVLPGGGDKPVAAAPDNSAELARLRQEADKAKLDAADARKQADAVTADLRKSLAEAGVANADRPPEAIRALVTGKAADAARIQQLTAEAGKHREAAAGLLKTANDASRNLAAAQAETAAARTDLVEARKASDAARKELADAKKAADDRLAKAQADAEAKEKAALAKVDELTRREAEYAKAADAAKKAAEDAARARDATAATIKELGDRLAKAKFVGPTPDAPALVKGLDDALKAATTDATTALRDELTKARAEEAKLKTDLTAAREKEMAAARAADAQKAEAQKLSAELAKATTDTDRLTRLAADAAAKAQAAAKAAEAAKADADRLAAETAKLKTENDRLTRDLDAVRELAALIKTSPDALPMVKPEPGKLAERFYADGLRAFYAGRYPEAESAFRKAMQFNPDDARYHYLLGLALWMTRDTAAAEAEFEKGRDLELAGRPSSRVVSATLERIQGPARQAVNAHRP